MTCVETPVSQRCCRPVCSQVEYYVVWLCLLGPEDSLMIPTWLCSTRSWLRVCLPLTLVLLALKWACMFLVWISLLLQFQWVWESWEQEIRTWYVSSQLHVKNFFLFVWLFCLFISCLEVQGCLFWYCDNHVASKFPSRLLKFPLNISPVTMMLTQFK